MVRLSILICTMPKRINLLNALLEHLNKQRINLPVDILVDDTDQRIGIKRNALLEHAEGDYIVYIDDDDEVSDKYIPAILAAIESEPDCVGICGTMTTNGRNSEKWIISKDIADWSKKNGYYLRHTNHLSPVKRSIAQTVRFPKTSHGEDYAYSMALKGKLHTEVKIEEPIYHYKYVTAK